MAETTSYSVDSRPFRDLRGVRWRVDLGILPSSPSASIDDLRRVTANSRRSYASLRKQLLVDPHLPKDPGSSPDLVMDNPLSQDPDSMWGRFFRNAELERMVDQDLTRLYPERGSYFQTSTCQGMLRRILLLWCLRHPECGYRQGMHELLAPLLYVLHIDVECLSEVRRAHEDHFADKFDGFSYQDKNSSYKFDFKKPAEASGDEDHPCPENKTPKQGSLADLDLGTRTIVLLSDAYGVEGELGTVLSEKFTEHDAYTMFDALMCKPHIAMSDFFSPSSSARSLSGLSPIIDASCAVYQLLAAADPSLHAHLVEFGVEPQYFTLRWLRVLFGREFSLENLLLIWDETFACDNSISKKDAGVGSYFAVLDSSRGAFVISFAVSMMLKLRSSLLATENATVCLQRLLNFPNDVNLKKLISKAKLLQELATGLLNPGSFDGKRPVIARGHTLSLDSDSGRTPFKASYWEEKWRVLHEEPCLSSNKIDSAERIHEPSDRRSLLEDLARQLQDDNRKNAGCNNNNDDHDVKENPACNCEENEDKAGNKREELFEVNGQDDVTPDFQDFSNPCSPHINRESSDVENESGSSSVASNSSIDESYANKRAADDGHDMSSKYCAKENDDDGSSRESFAKDVKEGRKGKLKWLWKIGRHAGRATSSSKPSDVEGCNNSDIGQVYHVSGFSLRGGDETSKGEVVDQNLVLSLRNLGHSMVKNIKVIESVLQEAHGRLGPSESLSKGGVVVEKGQATAISALKELKNISRILSEM